ncbi:gamma-glutamyl hydrolase-like, partial [Eucyclogobius newberryi]|uniref:gamma-glutamyl hydrolase-like n=1 Tax=Eucyclogobius newberryi TaxID=166745 RepID=UPI003B5AE82D
FLRIGQTEEEYTKLFNSINGFFLPGGAANIFDSGYEKAATVFYHLAVEANKKGDYFPIWGTCLGFEQLAVLTAQKNILVRTNTSAVSLPLNFTDEANGSKMFRDFPPEMMHALATEPMTINAHKWSISMETYHENADLNRFYKVLSTNTDGMVEFISTFEAFDYPFYGVQWHPEKHPYEWTQDFYGHSPNSIRLTFYIAEFFVSEARKNKHKFESEKAIRDLLIYHFHPNYTGETASVFEQKYFFYDEQEEEEPPEEDIFRASGAGQTLAEVNMVLVTAVFLTGILSAEAKAEQPLLRPK